MLFSFGVVLGVATPLQLLVMTVPDHDYDADDHDCNDDDNDGNRDYKYDDLL